MDSSPDNFDSLEKLLRLKKYEKPPPRYFNDFSHRVLARIEAGESRHSWWERFGFDLRPAFAAAAGVLACGLVVYGVATTDDNPESFKPADAVNLASGNDARTANSTNPVTYGTPIDRNVFGASVTPVSFRR
jgi:hypothetical protein